MVYQTSSIVNIITLFLFVWSLSACTDPDPSPNKGTTTEPVSLSDVANDTPQSPQQPTVPTEQSPQQPTVPTEQSPPTGSTQTALSNCASQEQVSTIAGTGVVGAQDGIGIQATFNNPSAIVINAQKDTLYIADELNATIRQITCENNQYNVTTIAGTGIEGDNDGPAQEAQFYLPVALALDPPYLYIGDYRNNRVRTLNLETKTVTTLAGTGIAGYNDGSAQNAQFNGINGLTLGISGEIYVIEELNRRIRRIVCNPTCSVDTFAGDGALGNDNGPSNTASFAVPTDIVQASDGALYVTDWFDHTIRQINNDHVYPFAGSGQEGFGDGTLETAVFAHPRRIDFSNEQLYIADQGNHAIRVISLNNQRVYTLAGNGIANFADGTRQEAMFSTPRGLTLDSEGAVYVSDSDNHRIRRIQIPENFDATTAAMKTK